MNRQLLFIVLLLVMLVTVANHDLRAQQQICRDLIIEVAAEKAGDFNSKQQVQAGDITFRIQPLLKSQFRKNWFVATPETKNELSNWDLAHYLVANHQDVVYAEPDYSPIEKYNDNITAKRGCGESAYNNDWPHPAQLEFAWHLGDNFSQLLAARQPDQAEKVRIAHCDTGYDPTHVSVPKYLRTDLQHNFVDGENENSAVDIGSEGLLNQPGHGTSTLSVLAGNKVSRPQNNFDNYVGGAPFAEIVPIRLSKSVILYKSSAFVQALYYIMQPEVKCDVLSMSMGGVASKYWADAVNDAYEHGIILVTAAGNNFGQLPTTHTVFPARFNRVISVCGVAYDNTPYFKFGLFDFRMQGNYGPDEVMDSAIAAYTPNMMWALMGCGSSFDYDGGGTSAATPQVAAAVALWLQKYRSQQYNYPWQRVNAVRHALFSSARKDLANSRKYYGNGVLQTAKALQVAPQLDSQPLEKDEVSFPIWTILFGSERSPSAAVRQMISVELLRLEHNSLVLQRIFSEIEKTGKMTANQKQIIEQEIRAIPYTSQTLLQLLGSH